MSVCHPAAATGPFAQHTLPISRWRFEASLCLNSYLRYKADESKRVNGNDRHAHDGHLAETPLLYSDPSPLCPSTPSLHH